MDLKPTKPLSGFIELTPVQQRCFDECAKRMHNVLRGAGFNPLDLPAIERAEVLTDKDNWDEIETQMFLFQKGDTKMGLRYDGTVGLSRYVAGNINSLVFPFRAYQFARNYRGERPQRGRYREFYQMDLDVLGVNSLSTNYDAEIVATLSRVYESVAEFIGPTVVRVGNRKFWNAMFDFLNLDEKQRRSAFVLIDKKDKLSAILESVKVYGYLDSLSKASVSRIEDIIREIGTFRRKSIYVKEIASKLVNDGYDYVPNDREYIESLPGVGRKTANVFLSNIYNEQAIAVDTHVSRVSKRLGFANEIDNVYEIEKKLEKKIPKDRWGKTHHQLVLFGRYHCKAIKPLCDNCKIRDICNYIKK